MSLELTSQPSHEDQSKVIDSLRSYNTDLVPAHVESLCIFDRLESGEVIGGLIGKTYWDYLDISYLWVDSSYRSQGRATAIIRMAEEEAVRRGCNNSLVDTYSFQALEFYQKQGYREFGSIDGIAGEHTRHYLRKQIGS